MFQFLIGTLKTFCIQLQEEKKKPVSIPYRHSKNSNKGKARGSRTEFQFLIGTLKTKCYLLPSPHRRYCFNSL